MNIFVIKTYVTALIAFVSLDAVWLTCMAPFYTQQIGFLMSNSIKWVAAGALYAFFVAGLVFFAVLPELTHGSATSVLLRGAFLGFISYGCYDLTNLATIKNWPLTITCLDMGWGTVLSGVVALITYLVMHSKYF